MAAVGAIVRHHIKLVGRSAEFIFENQEILGAETDHGGHRTALLMQLLRDRISYRTAHAAADDGHLLQTLRMGRNAQRSYKIMNRISFFQMIEFHGRCPYDLEDDRNRSLFPVKIGYCQRNSLAILIHTQDDKLTRLRLLGDQGRFHFH